MVMGVVLLTRQTDKEQVTQSYKQPCGEEVGMRNVAVLGAARIARSAERWHRLRRYGRSGIYLIRNVP